MNYLKVIHSAAGKGKRPPEAAHQGREFLGKGVLKICSKFTGEHPRRSVISMKLLCNFIEITLRRGYSPVNVLHIFKTPFYKNTSGGLLLNHLYSLLRIPSSREHSGVLCSFASDLAHVIRLLLDEIYSSLETSI